jgi:acyl carrier protein
MHTNESDIFTTVRRVLADVTHDDTVLDLGPEARLRDELGIDSMTSLTFLMALEDAIAGFAVDAATLEAEHFETIGSICRYVALQLATEMVG